MTDEPSREERLRDLVAGEADERSEATLDPEDRRVLAQYRALQRVFDRDRRAEREMLASIAANEEPADESLVRGVLDPLTRSTSSWVSGAVLAIAALTLVVVTVFAWRRSSPRLAGESYLSLSDGRLVPAGEVVEYGPFSWTIERPPGGSFRLQLLDEAGEVLVESPTLSESRWTLGPGLAEALPNRILWRLRVFDASGGFVASHDEWAWRTP